MTPYYKKQLENGLIYQDFVLEILHKFGISTVAYGSKLFQQRLGENKAGIEIKFDDKLATTGNLWIEVAEKSDPANPAYVVSGIHRECVEYVIGNYDTIFRFATNWLRRLSETERYAVRENNLRTSRGFLLPAAVAERCATQVIHPKCGEKMAEILVEVNRNRLAAKSEMLELLRIMECHPSQFELFPPPGRPHA